MSGAERAAPLTDALYPSGVICLLCGALSHGEALCPDCAEALRKRRYRGRAWEAVAAYEYEGEAAELIRLLKFRAAACAAAVLAQGVADALAGETLPPGTVVTWVPMPEKRRRRRGIDHGALLAGEVAKRLSLPCRPLMRRVGALSHTQRGLNRAQRLRNLTGAFETAERFDGHVLLVDDVTTTGATLHMCRACLTSGGASGVTAAVCARRRAKGKARGGRAK